MRCRELVELLESHDLGYLPPHTLLVYVEGVGNSAGTWIPLKPENLATTTIENIKGRYIYDKSLINKLKK